MTSRRHTISHRRVAIMIATTLVSSAALVTESPALAVVDRVDEPPDPGMGQVVEEFPGDLSGPYSETYLLDESESHSATETPHIASWPSGAWTPHPYATKRWADGDGWFTYRLPVDPTTTGSLRLTMVTKGEMIVEVDGSVVLDTGNTGQGDYTPREFLLSDAALWVDGHVDVRFSDADTSDGWGPNLYRLELGPTSSLRERITALEFGSSLVWNHGLPDGTANEFRGVATDYVVGTAWEDTAGTGTLTLGWDQQVDSDTRYMLHVGIVGRIAGGWNHVAGTQTLDVGADGVMEASTTVGGEKVMDVDVTSYVEPTGNVAQVTMPPGARLDFAALVAVPDEPEPLTTQPIYFGGNELAEDFTRMMNTSWYFTLTMLNDKNSGFIDSSMINGAFANTLFIADFGPALLEMFHEGYYDRSREAVEYAVPDVSGHYEQDIAAGNYIFATMLGLIKIDNYSSASKVQHWSRIVAGMGRLGQLINATPLHLVEGTNWETSGQSQGLYASATSYYTLLAAAEAADRLGEATSAAQWRDWAATLAAGMNANLVWPAGASWLGQPMPEGTWRYGRTDSGGDPASVRAGWHAIGSAKDLYYGLLGDDTVWRTRTDATLDAHMEAFWPDWTSVGNNKGFGTDYGVLSERGGWPLNSLLEGDRIGDATKNLDHVIFNSTDRNFAPFGANQANTADNAADYSEWSPYLIIRETDSQDRGSSAYVGNGPGSEDLNLVEYILFLKNARLIAGVDDQLQGTANLRIAPRLPWTWTTAGVNDRPVAFRASDGSYGTTILNFALERTETDATLTATTDDDVFGVAVRLGPFPLTSTSAQATVNGMAVPSQFTQNGDAKWITVMADLGSSPTTIVGSVSDPAVSALPALNSLSGITTTSGSWSADDGRLSVEALSGDAWALLDSPSVVDASVRADVRLTEGNAVGVSTRMGTAGSTGYDLIIDRVDGAVKIVKRPYVSLASTSMPVSLDRTYRLELRAVGQELIGIVDGVEVLRVIDSSYAAGSAGTFAYKSTASFTNLIIRE